MDKTEHYILFGILLVAVLYLIIVAVVQPVGLLWGGST